MLPSSFSKSYSDVHKNYHKEQDYKTINLLTEKLYKDMVVTVTSQQGLSRNGAVKEQKSSLFVPLSYFKTQRLNIYQVSILGQKNLGVGSNQHLIFQRQLNVPQFIPNKSLGQRFLSNPFTLLTNIDIPSGFNEHSTTACQGGMLP